MAYIENGETRARIEDLQSDKHLTNAPTVGDASSTTVAAGAGRGGAGGQPPAPSKAPRRVRVAGAVVGGLLTAALVAGSVAAASASGSTTRDKWCKTALCPVINGHKWVVIQAQMRGDSDVTFSLPWQFYVRGFGNWPHGDYWLGLTAIRELCPTHRPCQLRVELEAYGRPCPPWVKHCMPQTEDCHYQTTYAVFAVADAADKFRLLISSPSGNAGDAMSMNNGSRFSTVDMDHDWLHGSCSKQHFGRGGWWFKACSTSNLNGYWHVHGGYGLFWLPVTNFMSAETARMLVRVAE